MTAVLDASHLLCDHCIQATHRPRGDAQGCASQIPKQHAMLQGVLGYVILRPLMTAVGFVASLIGVYGDGELRFDRVYLYTTIVSNISQASCPPSV